MQYRLCVPCLLGLEGPISDELKRLNLSGVAAENGRVYFDGDEASVAAANISLRIGERVLLEVGRFTATTFDALFEAVKALPWEAYIPKDCAFPVKGYCLNSTLMSVPDCQKIIKKAVVERLKTRYHLTWFAETGPVHQIQFSIMKDQVSLLLDTSGYGLHKRGYRLEAGGAPIKETLAAALCWLSRVRPYHTLYDPMCGSGTILIEGALLAHNIAPGKNRSFSAERWDQIPEEVWRLERERAADLELRESSFAAFGSDIDSAALELAKANAQRAGVADRITFERRDLRDFAPQSEKGTLICNPPYGERLFDLKAAEELYRLMGQKFVQQHGWSYSIISPSEDFEYFFGRKADKRRKLYNGMIKCQLYMYFK